jgi:type IV secretory pathway VirB4 component
VVIDPYTAQINPLQLGSSTRSIEFLEYIFSALLDTAMTPLQKTLFRSVLALLLQVPNATLETFREVLTHGWKPYEQYVNQCDPSTRDFFVAKEFDSPTYRETKQQVLWRLRLILSNDYLRAIFTAPKTNVHFSELLDSGKLIVIDTEIDDLGEQGAEFFGRFFVALIWMYAVSRSKLRMEDKLPVYVYIDECQTVIARDEKVATILDTCRSQKIALILSHQRIAQIQSPNVLDALNNCAIRFANSDDDAEALAKRFRVDASQLRLPRGSFACFVRDVTAQARTISVPEFDLSQFPPPPLRAPQPTRSHKSDEAPHKPEPLLVAEPPPTLDTPPPRKKGR